MEIQSGDPGAQYPSRPIRVVVPFSPGGQPDIYMRLLLPLLMETFGQQIVVALMCILAGIGTAGVPGGSLPLVVGVLMAIKVPPQSIAIILGIDRFLDMCRSALNVTGDLVIAAVVARGESDDEDEGGPAPTGEAVYVDDLPAAPA